MEALLSPASLARDVEALAAGTYLQDPLALLGDALALLTPPERISTVDCAETRKLPGATDGAVVRYDRWQTPYNVGPMNSLDNPGCNLIVMVKPSRSGGTTVVENYLFKIAKFGPMGHVAWYLNTDDAVRDYCRTVVKPMFELNPDLQARVGTERGDDTDSFKRLSNYPLEFLAAKDSNFRNREPVLMVSDETDAWAKRFAASPKVQIDGRQKRIGSRRKAAILSHADLGWTSGVAAAYEDTSRGIFVMQCPECLGHAAAYATKFWPGVPEFRLHWDANRYVDDPDVPGRRRIAAPRDQLGKDERLALAERTASMLCPHCGASLTDAQRREMIDAALRDATNALAGWMHRGQTLDPDEGVVGEMDPNPEHGFWVHGLMLKTETLAKLARDYEAALTDFERTRNPAKLREFLCKQLGEIYEGAATTGGFSANGLKARAKASTYLRGVAPDGVLFVTAAIDPGGRKFDVLFLGWDREGRSWLLDRVTLRQRRHEDGRMRDLHLARQIDDWNVLFDEVLYRTFPLESDPDMALPVACVTLDNHDGNVTWKAREFARRARRAGYEWGRAKWPRLRLVMGADGKRAILPDVPRKVGRDQQGRPVQPVIHEYTVGVDKLKDLTLERIAISDDAPGQCFFPADLEESYVDEFFGETKIDGKWVRSGPNETLDLYGYAEVARLIIEPDRADLWSGGNLPLWARPIPVKPDTTPVQPKGGDQAAEGRAVTPQRNTDANPAAKALLERFAAANRRT